jgi:hypothetical protein
MKTTKLALATLALAGAAVFANTASAHTDFRVSIGFGVPAPVVRYASAPVAYCPAPVVAAPVVVMPRYEHPAGYWKDVVVKTWVPARYVDTRGHHGRIVRVLEPGYFTYRTERVWVSNCG